MEAIKRPDKVLVLGSEMEDTPGPNRHHLFLTLPDTEDAYKAASLLEIADHLFWAMGKNPHGQDMTIETAQKRWARAKQVRGYQ